MVRFDSVFRLVCVCALSAAAVACSAATIGDESPDNPPGTVDLPTDDPAGDDPNQPLIWSPAPGVSWQWQLVGDIDHSVDADVFDIDLFDVDDSDIERLHADGRIVICYFSAGSYEEWRDDADQFPAAAVGEPLDGWPGESWLDIRSSGIRSLMLDRLDYAAERGCDAVEPDNVDGYTQDSGFPALTYQDQIDYNSFLANEAHARGLSIGLKNDLNQIGDLVDLFDWALNEECMEYSECDVISPFIAAGKAVLHVEYGTESIRDATCARAEELEFDSLVKDHLDADRIACGP